MFLLILIIVLSLLTTFADDLAKPIKAYFRKPTMQERIILQEISELKLQLATISLRDEYTQYVKTERKVVALEQQLSSLRGRSTVGNLLLNSMIGYGCQALLSLVLVFISILYRYEPVIIFEENFNFSPFASIIRFPTGVEGAISVPFWIFVSSFTSRSIAGMLK